MILIEYGWYMMMRWVTTLIFGFLIGAVYADTGLTKQQESALFKKFTKHLEEHPEFLIKASETLEKQERAKHDKSLVNLVLGKEGNNKDVPNELLNDELTPFVGPKDAKVAIIEFFDYQCSICSLVNPVFEQLVKTNSNVKFIFKDYPIFGTTWPASDYAANVGVLVYQKGGGGPVS